MRVTIPAILDLWFEPGTPADAANAANNCCDPSNRTWTAERVRSEWLKAQKDGRLPNLMRPHAGFSGDALVVVRKLKAGRRSA